MAMITFSGYPCSGKSTRAIELKTFLQHKLQSAGSSMKIIVINDESLALSKTSYDGTSSQMRLQYNVLMFVWSRCQTVKQRSQPERLCTLLSSECWLQNL